MHQIARRWVAAGAHVTWFTGRGPGQEAVRRSSTASTSCGAGGELSLYLHAAAQMVRSRADVDVVVDCQNGIPFFSPLFAGDGRARRPGGSPRAPGPVRHALPPPGCGPGPVSRGHGDAPRLRPAGRGGGVALDPAGAAASAALRRSDLRGAQRLDRRPGPDGPPRPRSDDRRRLAAGAAQAHRPVAPPRADGGAAGPGLRVDIVGDGPDRIRLQALVTDLGLQHTVTFHGYQPDGVRDSLLSRAWVTTATSVAEGWGCSVIEAAAWGVPCVAMAAPGINDSVVDGRTGWIVGPGRDFGRVLADTLEVLADDRRARSDRGGLPDLGPLFLVGPQRRAPRRSGLRGSRRSRTPFATPSVAMPAATSAPWLPSRRPMPATCERGCERQTRSSRPVRRDVAAAGRLRRVRRSHRSAATRRTGRRRAVGRAEDLLAGPGAARRLARQFGGTAAGVP